MARDKMKDFTFLFVPGGGIGDLIISLPVLDVLIKYIAPIAEIDVCIAHPTQIYRDILGDKSGYIRHIYEGDVPEDVPKYSGSLLANEVCDVRLGYKILDKIPEFLYLLREGKSRIEMLGDCTALAPFMNNELANRGVELGLTRATMPLWSLGLHQYPSPKLGKPKPINSRMPFYITINDGWDGKRPERGTKSWSPEAWAEFVALCNAGGVKVIQLGSKANGQEIPGVDVQLRGQTSFAESLAILCASSCHVDIEGGLVHAATALRTKCVVLFGPTNKDFFGYPQNINLNAADECVNCWWKRKDWMEKCMKDNHVCMKHRPEDVFNAVQSILKSLS